MGQNLVDLNIQDTYQGLIKTNGCNENIGPSFTILTDGAGNDSSLALSQAGCGIRVTGCSTFLCDTTICCSLNLPNNIIRDSGTTRITLGNTITLNGNIKINCNTILDSTDCNRISFNTSTDTISLDCNVTVAGNLSAGGDLVAFYTSDERLKDNLQPIESSSFIDNLTGYSFDWNENSNLNGRSYGLIAQDVEKIAPELIYQRVDGYKSVNYIPLISILFEEVKSLKAKVIELEANR